MALQTFPFSFIAIVKPDRYNSCNNYPYNWGIKYTKTLAKHRLLYQYNPPLIEGNAPHHTLDYRI